MKQTIEVVVSFVVLLAFAPLMSLTIAALAAGAGPVLKRDRFVGRGGRPFHRLSFETAPQTDDGILLAGLRDYLRQSGLGVLPQLVNVIRGEMAIVGPEPLIAELLGSYGDYAKAYMSLRPGLTGVWRLQSRPRSIESRGQLDTAYWSRRCVLMDAAILLQSAPLAFRGRDFAQG